MLQRVLGATPKPIPSRPGSAHTWAHRLRYAAQREASMAESLAYVAARCASWGGCVAGVVDVEVEADYIPAPSKGSPGWKP